MKDRRYDVGGVLLERPFKVRRLNHVAFYYRDFRDAIRFYVGALGLRLVDCLDENSAPPPLAVWSNHIRKTPLGFISIGMDHHNITLIPDSMREIFGPGGRHSSTKINHYAWDLGSYEELRGFLRYCRDRRVEVFDVALRMPGSNYAVYYYDPDGNLQHTQWNEEILGWNGLPKPYTLWPSMGFARGSEGELDEVIKCDKEATMQALMALERLGRPTSASSIEPYKELLEDVTREFGGKEFNVHGTLLQRPFSLSKLTYVAIQSEDLDKAVQFYSEVMGFKISARTHEAVYLRCNVDHHCLVVYSPEASPIGSSRAGRLVRIGIQIRTYSELKAASSYLADYGFEIVSKGRSFPGGEYYIDVLDPEDRVVRLFFYIEKVGWDGTTRPRELWSPLDDLPDQAEVSEDIYNEELPTTYNIL